MSLKLFSSQQKFFLVSTKTDDRLTHQSGKLNQIISIEPESLTLDRRQGEEGGRWCRATLCASHLINYSDKLTTKS